MSEIKAPSRTEELTVSSKDSSVECLLEIAVLNLEEDPKQYQDPRFGNYPEDGDDNIHCITCDFQLDCRKQTGTQ